MIRIDNVHVVFKKGLWGRIRALDGLNLEISEGDVFSLIGPNGAGKSTAMYCMLGLVRPSSGSVTLFGERPLPGSSVFSDVAYLPEEPHYHDYLTVFEAVVYYTRLFGLADARKKAMLALDRVGLKDFLDLRVSKCSKGMKQKVGIAQCLVSKPRLVFMDEPTRGLDPVTIKHFKDIVAEMRKNGATIVINSHVLSEVEEISNRVAIINRGKSIFSGEVAGLKTLDSDIYDVELDATETKLPGMTVTGTFGGAVKGTVPRAALPEFMSAARDAGVTLRSCSIKKTSLEDAFLKALEKDGKR